MAKYKSKPIIIEAEQWFPNKSVDVVMCLPEPFPKDGYYYYVRTINGENVRIHPGEWIITEPDGIHHYPCKPDIFEKRYEPLDN
jgi:hypothetical protein